MYYHITTNSGVEKITDQEASKRMKKISSQWESESNNLGEISMGVYDWAFSAAGSGVQLHIPKLRTGGSIPKNEIAAKLFGFDIFGDCFLKPKDSELDKIDELLAAG